VTISLAHCLTRGTLIVSLDGKPVLTERFSRAKLALLQTTTWDPLQAPVGAHELTAQVYGGNGKTYRSESFPVELSKRSGTAIRISFKGDALVIRQKPG
jgi:hypothetical protein